MGTFSHYRRTSFEDREAGQLRFVPLLLLTLIVAFGPAARAQEMEARAYSPAPVGANYALFLYSYQSGDVLLNPLLPLRDVKVEINSATVGYGRTFNLAGRQATASMSLSYISVGVSGTVFGRQEELTRSGLRDPRIRLSINLIGSPALSPREFAARKPSPVLGASLTVVAPTGQYDPRRLVNLGSNRFAFKPELGLSHPVGPWTLELIGGVWLFTDNKDFFGGMRREQKLLTSFQGHAIYTLRPRMWLAGNATYYRGGQTIVNGRNNADLQDNSRVGATFSLPVVQGHSLRLIWSRGLKARIGGDLTSFAVGWQYIWLK